MAASVVAGLSAWGCKGCDSPSTTPDASPSSSASASASGDGAAPYLPSRMLPDDSPEQTSLVEQTLMTLRPQLNVCYREASKANPKLEADTILAITLDANGHVTDVRPVTKNNVDDAFLGCLRRQIQTAVFVKPPIDAGTVSFNVPFVFRPRPDGGKPRDASHD